jgi:hypothetical protein
MKLTFNGQGTIVTSIEQLDTELSRFDTVQTFELWIQVLDGPMMSMLRNGPSAFLMYVRLIGDAGFTTRTAATSAGTASFRLANGQIDEYPLSCVSSSRTVTKRLRTSL